jgi:gliding motility-associated-like protein
MIKRFITIFIYIIGQAGIILAQNCPNSNFSMQNFSNWTGTTGTVPNNGGTPYDVPGIITGQHTIITVNSPDPNTGGALNTIPPGYTTSCKLGNDLAQYGAESMTYTLTVDMTNRLFVYNFAMVLQDPVSPPHAVPEKPKFIVNVKDAATGQTLPGNCSYYETYGGDPTNNFTYYTSQITYSEWKKVVIDLTNYVGSTINIQFTTQDCGLGAHWGYAYITTSCGPFDLDIQKNCNGEITITAPEGFESYLWSPGGETTQTITLQNPPTGDYYFSCTMNPITGLSCPSFIDTSFSFIATPTLLVNDAEICIGESATLTAVCNEVGGTYSWNPTNATTPQITVAPQTTSTYIVTYNALNNCSYNDTAIVIVNELPVIILDDFYVCIGDQAILNPEPDQYDYVWEGGFQSNVPFIPSSSQYYTVIATDTVTGCQNTDSIFIEIKPLPFANFGFECGQIPAEFLNASVGAINYLWDFGDNSPLNTEISPIHPYPVNENDTYLVTLTAYSEFGCAQSSSQVYVMPQLLYVPNTFTPDGDEFNNYFSPVFSYPQKVRDYHFTIYNRWGEIIFESYDVYSRWDGTYEYKIVQDGTYNWELYYYDFICNRGTQHIYGHVNLIR